MARVGPAEAGGFAEMFVAAYLEAGSGQEQAVQNFYPGPVDLQGVIPGGRYASRTATVRARTAGPGYWAVTVGAEVLVLAQGGYARGGVHYYHHLAHFYLESRPDPEEAVRWSRADHELRPNLETRALWNRAVEAEERRAEAAAGPEARREQVRHPPIGDHRLIAGAARPGEGGLGQRDSSA